jgi:RNA polymerase sigma-70 factor, ECF subfamily
VDPNTEQQLSWLLRQAQAGDHAAYRQFLLETRELVRTFLRHRLRSTSALDDVLQETLLSIHRSRHSYDPARPIGPWIHAIALNRLRDFGRARKRQQDRAAVDLEWEKAMHAGGNGDAAPTSLRAALETLSEAQREVIWLLKFEGYSVAEIAGRTGRSAGAIKVTAHRGYRVLRALLRAR